MNKYVIDTMALVLYLERRKLPSFVKNCFIESEQNITELLIPAMTLAEIGYLSEKGRISANLKMIHTLLMDYPCFQSIPLSIDIIQSSFEILDILELHDRLIAGTAKHFNLPLLTNDPVIAKSNSLQTIWR